MKEYLTIKEYAKSNKISIFQTIKLVREGKVESITKDENGKEVVYIKNKIVEKPKNEPKKLSLEEEVKALRSKIEELEDRLSKLEAKS